MNAHAETQTSLFEGVELARPGDLDELFALLKGLHAENGMFPMDDDVVREQLAAMLAPTGFGVVGVVRGSEGLEGSVGMTVEPWWYTRQLCLNERWNFVRPDCRRPGAAKRLIEFAKWASDRMEMPLIMGIISTIRTEAKMRLYQRQLDHVGGFFSHNLKSGGDRGQ